MHPVTATSDHYLQTIAWNTFSVQVPKGWTPVTIFKDYLLFEENGSPNAAMRWIRIDNPPGPDNILKNLSKSKKFALHGTWELPQSLKDTLPELDLAGFIWSENRFQGQGILAVHRLKGWIVLLQIYDPSLLESPLPASLLGSIDFSGQDSPTDYALFDISLQVPPLYTLHRYSFFPGKFELEFLHKHCRLCFYRFKPAAVLLQHQTLHDWGQQMAGALPHLPGIQGERQEWESRQQGVKKYFSLMQGKPTHQWLEITHYPEKNCLLGLRYQGRLQPRSFLDEIRLTFRPR